MKNKKMELLIIVSLLLLQTLIYVAMGIQKSYIHMDEAYSLGLAGYKRTNIQDNEDFYNEWHSKDYYEDYLSIQKNEEKEYQQVYENQKNDVHPPLYYLILRFVMGFHLNQYSKWPGLIINIIIYIFITLFMYAIMQKIFEEEPRAKEKSILLAFVSSITIASLDNVLYIRMYALSTLNILITIYLHIKLYEKESPKILILIGLTAIAGFLTHYFYLFFLVALYIIFAIKYIKQKHYKKLIRYTVTLFISGIVSLIIFPYSLQHMFLSDRGIGVTQSITNIPKVLENLGVFILTLNYYGFNNLLLLILILMFYLYRKTKGEKLKHNKYMKIVALPTLFYFLIVSISSPYTELRYILPVCALIFCIVMYYLYEFLKLKYKENANGIITIIIIALLISPLIFKIEPGVLYSEKREIVKEMSGKLNLPTIYLLDSQNNRFLDDILLFSKINESYIAKDMDLTDDNINKILKDKDISRGIIVFANYEKENSNIMKYIIESTSFSEYQHIEKLNACDVFYIK